MLQDISGTTEPGPAGGGAFLLMYDVKIEALDSNKK